ncbi:sigma factor-like helix-turn-helix DNA-binding protein [Streptomyces sp. NPDC004111]|uniref:sigma factor-like helix-turn-helix DNA-binding protein n=1 Tax=Streptomyces sp. NPDC004111 TaxID=3364690 RepID=UPI0036AF1F79
MSEREAVQQRRHAKEFESFVAGATGRLLHAATLLTAEPADANPRAQQLLAAALASTYAHWAGLRGEDPYDRTRQELATRFARSAWHHRAWHRRRRRGGLLELLTPQERLVVVLRLYEGVPEEQTAALLGLPAQRVRALCARAVAQVYEAHGTDRTATAP